MYTTARIDNRGPTRIHLSRKVPQGAADANVPSAWLILLRLGKRQDAVLVQGLLRDVDNV